MRISAFVVLGLASLALAACKKEPEPAPKPVVPVEDVINMEYQDISPGTSGYHVKECVVCGKELATLGHPRLAIAYKAYEVQVCDKKCLREFAKDPQGIIRQKVNPKAMFDR